MNEKKAEEIIDRYKDHNPVQYTIFDPIEPISAVPQIGG